VAERFNYRYGETFRVPDGQYPEIGGRIMDLQEPTNKMSTSTSSEQGAVYIADSPEAIRKKFKTAVTDSEPEVRYDPKEKPGVSNLLEIMSVAPASRSTRSEALRMPATATEGGRRRVIVELLTPIRERSDALRGRARAAAAAGLVAEKAAAQPTLELMYDRMGFVRPEAGRFFGAVRPRGL
jgi:tryptophanyl-tRNA synthetase